MRERFVELNSTFRLAQEPPEYKSFPRSGDYRHIL